MVLSFPEFCWWRADHFSGLHHTFVLSRRFPHLFSYSILTLERGSGPGFELCDLSKAVKWCECQFLTSQLGAVIVRLL